MKIDYESMNEPVMQNDVYKKFRMQELEAQKLELMRQIDVNLDYIKYFISTSKMNIQAGSGLNYIKNYLNKPAKIDDIRNLQNCIQEFKDFFESYNHYILHDPGMRRNCQKGYSDEFIVSTGLSRTKYYWSLILQSINQRYNPIYSDLLEIANALTENLYTKMDKLNPATDESKTVIGNEKLVEKKQKVRPVIYFDKIFHISRFPYQMQPLIGLSIDASVFNLRKYNSLQLDKVNEEKIEIESIVSHELGHYTFWNNGNLRTYHQRRNAISEIIARIVFSNLPTDACADGAVAGSATICDDPLVITDSIPFNAEERGAIFFVWQNWSEEVFADIFGALLVGPGYVKKAQDIILRKGLEKRALFKNDREHPMLILRPFITLAVLKVLLEHVPADITVRLKKIYRELAKRWYLDFCGSTVQNPNYSPEDAKDILKVDPERLRVFVEPIVRAIMHAKMFDISPDNNPISLLEGLDYWGKVSGDKRVLADMDYLRRVLVSDRIINDDTASDKLDRSIVYKKVFQPFKAYYDQLFNEKKAVHTLICNEILSIEMVRSEVYEVDLFGGRHHLGCGGTR